MGFSPWPYDATNEAVEWTYATIASQADLISQHIEEGVPWPEMLGGGEFPAGYLLSLQGRKNHQAPGQKLLLSINCLNMLRNGLAPYRGDLPNMPLPPAWAGLPFDSPLVKTAYLNYAKKMKEFFEPDYFEVGVEVNLLLRNAPNLWPAYLALQEYLYGEMKALYPNLPILVSFDCNPFFPEYSSQDNLALQTQGLAQLEPFLDKVAFSVHPFLSGLFAESFPDDYFDRLFALTAKPLAISESSYPAQVWSLPSHPDWVWNGSPEKQDAFLQKMLAAAQGRQLAFVVWFSIRDYDALWHNALGESEMALPWRDTGLYDEDGNERLAVTTWRKALELPHSP